MRSKLNKTAVEALEPPAKGSRYVWDNALSDFGVRITSNGVRSYIVQARVAGKTRRSTIGRHGALISEQARQRARTELGRMSAGTDPSAERQRQRAFGVTLREVADAYQRDRRDLKESTRADIRKHLAGAFADWADRSISSLTRDKVASRFRELSERSPVQANQSMRALYNFAWAQYRSPDGEPVLGENPVRVLSDARMWNMVKARNDYVPLERLGAWWSAVQAQRVDPSLPPVSRAAADLVAVMALTGLRIGEARALRWEQVDFDDASLTLRDTKNREDVTLPLFSVAADILRARDDGGEYVFPGQGGGHIRECRGALAKIGEATGIEVRAHDLRRTFPAVAGHVGIELWRCKALMNHAQRQDVTLGAYTDLNDVRYLRPETNRIAEHFEAQRRIAEGENVVAMDRGHSS